MISNHWIDLLRQIYSRLLYLYPNEHRQEYGPSMLQVFTDQLRTAYREKGGWGVFCVWIHSLWDLGINVVKEQISSPNFAAGLMEAVPGSPLPWKGVALVLVPGLVFFIAQIAQLFGQDWFFMVAYRAAYFLILPVAIVWLWKRKFPIWGLVPLGLLFRTLWDSGYRLLVQDLSLTHPRWYQFLRMEKVNLDDIKIAIAVTLFILLLALLVTLSYRQLMPRKAWAWLGAYLVLSLSYLAANSWIYVSTDAYAVDWKQILVMLVPNYIADTTGLLLLILFGTFLSKRHGVLSMLLPMGYLLPTVLYGRFANYWNSLPDQVVNSYLLLISITVFLYRFMVALAAPLWIVRSASGQSQRKASLITLLIVLGIQAAMHIGVGVFMGLYYQYTGWGWAEWYVTVALELIAAAGVGLALTLYSRTMPKQEVSDEVAVRGTTTARTG